jgi:hypothetical protein
LSKRKFVLSPIVDKETNGSYPFAKGLIEQNVLAHLCLLGVGTYSECCHCFQKEVIPACPVTVIYIEIAYS